MKYIFKLKLSLIVCLYHLFKPTLQIRWQKSGSELEMFSKTNNNDITLGLLPFQRPSSGPNSCSRMATQLFEDIFPGIFDYIRIRNTTLYWKWWLTWEPGAHHRPRPHLVQGCWQRPWIRSGWTQRIIIDTSSGSSPPLDPEFGLFHIQRESTIFKSCFIFVPVPVHSLMFSLS